MNGTNLTGETMSSLEDEVESVKSMTATSQRKITSFYTSSSSSGNSTAVQKWYTHVMGGDHRDTNDDSKAPTAAQIEKIMAVYRVQYPFLPESQLRGKAWKSTGYVSHMGQTPRSLIKNPVKSKRANIRFKSFRKAQKPKLAKTPKTVNTPKIGSDSSNILNCNTPNESIIKRKVENSLNSCESTPKMKVQPKRRKLDLDINIPESPELQNKQIVPETMEGTSDKCEGFNSSKSTHCDSEVISPVASQSRIVEKNSNFDSSSLLNAIESIEEKFYDSDGDVMIKSTFKVVVDVHYTPDGIKVNPFSLDKSIKKISTLKDDDELSPSITENSQISKSLRNTIVNSQQSIENVDNFFSFLSPINFTQVITYNELSPKSMFSHVCCEYEKMYVEIKQSSNCHYEHKIDLKLIEDFNKVIPSNKTLKDFFDEDLSLKKLSKKIKRAVEIVLKTLEIDEM